MKKNSIILLFVGISTIFLANNCTFSHDSSGINSKDTAENSRDVSPFKSISLDVSADLTLIQGSPQQIILKGSAREIERILTVVEGTNLVIKAKNKFVNLNKIKIYVTMAEVEGLTISGSGTIVSQNSIKTNNLGLAISGSGDIVISDLSANTISSAISGSGSIRLNGQNNKIKSQDIAISGSGDIYAENLETENITVAINGSGSCHVFASNVLNAEIAGSGDVLYKGKPGVNANVSGSGKVKHID